MVRFLKFTFNKKKNYIYKRFYQLISYLDIGKKGKNNIYISSI